MDSMEWKQHIFYIRKISLLFGCFLLLGISCNEAWTSCLVSMSVVSLSNYEVLWLRRNKEDIKEIHWLGSNWTLISSAIAYVFVENTFLKIFIFFVMIVSVYVNLYRTCYYEKMSLKHIKCIICDSIILCYYYAMDFFEKDRTLIRTIKMKKIKIGILILITVVVSILLPLYIVADNRIEVILEWCVANVLYILPVCGVCFLLGVFPAIINYSIIKGLSCDLVLQNPDRNKKSPINIDRNNLVFNEITVKILLYGIIIINAIFIVLQVSNMFQLIASQDNIESLYSVNKTVAVLVIIGVSIFLTAISEYFALRNNRDICISWSVAIYVITLVLLLLVLLWRFFLKVKSYGITEFDVFELIYIIVCGVIFIILLCGIVINNMDFVHSISLCGTIVFVVISLIPMKYVVSNINVEVFLDKYQYNEVNDKVTVEDIDIDYLKEMEYDAVPALIRLMDIPLLCEGTDESLGEKTKGIVAEMFYVDMTNEEIESIGNLETEEEINTFANVLEDDFEYRVIGKKKIAFELFYEKLKTYSDEQIN